MHPQSLYVLYQNQELDPVYHDLQLNKKEKRKIKSGSECKSTLYFLSHCSGDIIKATLVNSME